MTRSLLFLGMLCASWSPLPAQVTEDFTSPRGTMFTFLDAVNDVRDGNDTSIVSATASLDLSAVGIDPASNEARQVARQLWASLNHIRLVEASELPTAATLRPTDSVFVYFPRPFNATDEAIRDRVDIGNNLIAFARQPDGRWLFSAETMSGIGALSTALSQLPAQVRVDEESLGAPAWVLAIVPEPLRIGAFFGASPLHDPLLFDELQLSF